MLRKHLVIVGGGWSGLSLIRSLKNVNFNELRITLISDEPNFRYSPGLYRVATGIRDHEAIIPIGEVLNDIRHVEFVLEKAEKIDRKTRTIKTTTGKVFHYDFAVLALGTVTSYFGIPGIEQNSYNIKTTAGLQRFRAHLHQELIDEKAPDKNYVVVGAGPTGVELAAALSTYLRKVTKWHGVRSSRISIDIVEASPKVLPSMPDKVGKKVYARLHRLGIKTMLKAKVESETANSLSVNGKSIPTQTVVWTAGVINSPFFEANASQFSFNERKKIIVDEHLSVDAHTYVIGDNAATPYSGLALTAVHNAQFVAKDIKRRISKRTRPAKYTPFKPATVVPVGSGWAIMQWRFITISGWAGALLRSAADFVGYMDILGFWKALEVWTNTEQQEEHCAVCKVQLAKRQDSQELLQTS